MIICLSGFVIAGTSPPAGALAGGPAPRANLKSLGAASVGGAGGAGGRYSAAQHQLLQQTALRSGASSPDSASERSASPPPGAATGGARYGRVRTLYACLGESEGELSFEPNQIITRVAPSGEPGWLRGELHGRAGLVPENYVEPLP